MKKRILSAMLLAAIATTSAIANETIPKADFKSDYKNTKEWMNDAKKNLPTVHDIMNDYFQAKTCKEDITLTTSIKEIREFANSFQYGVLIALKYQDTPLAKADYLTLISSYKLMNCGDKDAMSGFAAGTSAIAVEMNGKQK